MSALLRGGLLTETDFPLLADDVPVPEEGGVTLPLERWRREAEILKSRTGMRIGVRIPNTVDVLQVWPEFRNVTLIALEFPAFADGRAYSQARLLRDRCGYRGELRATGAAVVRDHLFGMSRCGFDAFELRADQDAATCLAAFADFSLAYQPAADGMPPVQALRTGA